MKRFSFLGLLAIALIVLGTPVFAQADTLYRQLEIGMSGSDVGSLQTFLAKDPVIYPQGLVTSYFGSFTKAAVANFQSRNDIPAVGRVGPMTLPIINAQMAAGISTGADVYAPVISNVNVNSNNGNGSAVISWNASESASGVVYFSNAPLTVSENLHSISLNSSSALTDTNFHASQNINITGLQRNTTYYYLISSTDQSGNVSITWPSTFLTN